MFRLSSLRREKSGAFKARKGIPADVRAEYQALYGKPQARSRPPAPELAGGRAFGLWWKRERKEWSWPRSSPLGVQ
jgi:hypothetical protein